jgi:hypothetical protein
LGRIFLETEIVAEIRRLTCNVAENIYSSAVLGSPKVKTSLVNFCTDVLLFVVCGNPCLNENGSNLVDSASSHTLVSKIKPCTSKYKYITVKLRMAHYISYSLFDNPLLLG